MKLRHTLVVTILFLYPVAYIIMKFLAFLITSVFLEEEINAFLKSIRFERMHDLIGIVFVGLLFLISWGLARISTPFVSKYFNQLEDYLDAKTTSLMQKAKSKVKS